MSDSTERQLSAIREVYGPGVDIYSDVLRVPRSATQAEIREAFFCLRYDSYRRLEDAAKATTLTAEDERRDAEARMDAIIAGYHVVSDPARRRAYDASIVVSKASSSSSKSSRGAGAAPATTTATATDDMGFPVVSPTPSFPGPNVRTRPSPLLLASSSFASPSGGRDSPLSFDFDATAVAPFLPTPRPAVRPPLPPPPAAAAEISTATTPGDEDVCP